ncbi:putative inactive purple acid phosphatase 16-like protein [Trifolium pratense]|uniref:Putative inactive purple acid phosphatase 16-like protein n=1 Tax=Trifolium pratense TaxID=57577 RepID=A0A2K3JU63_TRIPR|nr:putative inactive purple acid phosphatase 16-like protein [Trifolium pratense]
MVGSTWKTTLLRPLLFLSLLSSIIGKSSSSSNHHHQTTIRFKMAPPDAAAERQITMRREGAAFKVALFADLHFGEDAWTNWGPLQDIHSLKVMNTVLDYENPGHTTVFLICFDEYF